MNNNQSSKELRMNDVPKTTGDASEAFVGVVIPSSGLCGESSHVSGGSIGVDDALNPAPGAFDGSATKAQKEVLSILEARLTEVTNRLSAVVMALGVAILKQSPENLAGRLSDVDRDVLDASRKLRAEFLVFNGECVDVLTELERLLLDGKECGLNVRKAG